MTEEYYIRRQHSGTWGNSPVWWALGGNGYTAYLQNAERFPEATAMRMVEDDPEKWAAFKCSEVDRRAHLIFDTQDIRRLHIDPLDEPNPWGENCRYASAVTDAETSKLQAEVEGWKRSFDLYWDATMALNIMWRQEQPDERELVLNDAGKLCQWAVDRIKALEAELAENKRPEAD